MTNFNARTTVQRTGGPILPPPSSSLEGQLILGLHANNHLEDAQSAFLWFIHATAKINLHANNHINQRVQNGGMMHAAAKAAEALPFRRVTSQALSAAKRSTETLTTSLSEEVTRAQTINTDHATALDDFRDEAQTRSKRIEAITLRRERNRRKRYNAWQSDLDTELSQKHAAADELLAKIDKKANDDTEKHREEFEAIRDLFTNQMQFRAPVALWQKRAIAHASKAKWAHGTFAALAIIAMSIGILIPYQFGDDIAGSFTEEACNSFDPSNCTTVFSAKGPLTIAGLLLCMSLVLWSVRLQYRVYLSERHLALDASEKQAFAETYRAMTHDHAVDHGNEAIVLASLFRPTQDGIIRDDESGFDLSAAAVIAKQLGRNSP